MADTITTLAAAKDKQDSLILSALNCAVFVKEYDGTFPERFTDEEGKLLKLEGFKSIGEFQKDAGVGLSFSRDVDGPEGYGSKGKRRYIVSNEGLTLSVTAQETRLNTIDIVYDVNTQALVKNGKGNQADGGFIAKKNQGTRLPEYTVVVIGLDGLPGQEIYPLWIVPKMTMTAADDISLSDSGAIEYGLKFEASEDATYGALYGVGIVGPGMSDGKLLTLMAGEEPAAPTEPVTP